MPASGTDRAARWAGLAAVLVVVLVVAVALVQPDGTIVDCERDGHFQRVGHLVCGLTSTNAPYGPLLPYLVAPLVPLLGSPYLAARALSVLALLVLVLLTHRAARSLGGGAGLATLAALVVGVNGHLLFYGTMACSDMLATTLFTAALWLAFLSLREGGSNGLAAGAGLALAAACLVRVQYYLPAPVLLVAAVALVRGGLGRRARYAAVLSLAFAVPVLVGFLDGCLRYGSWATALDAHLGLAAYTRNLTRAGTILDSSVGVGGSDTVGLAARLLWSVRLVLRVTGAVPLLGAVGAMVLALRHARWRAALVVLLPALMLYGGLAWSHPPPEWGARRFYLYLVPVCAVPTLLVGRWLVERWLPRGRAAPLVACSVVALAAGAHGLLDLAHFRGVSPSPAALFAPRGTPVDVEVFDAAAALRSEVAPCTPVLTNFHGVTVHFRNAWFLGPVALTADAPWLASLPFGDPGGLALVWAPGGPEEPAFPETLGRFVLQGQRQQGSLWIAWYRNPDALESSG